MFLKSTFCVVQPHLFHESLFIITSRLLELNSLRPTFTRQTKLLNWYKMLIRKKLYDNHVYGIFNKHQFHTINNSRSKGRQCSKDTEFCRFNKRNNLIAWFHRKITQFACFISSPIKTDIKFREKRRKGVP